MFRLGMLSGKIYESDTDIDDIHECAICVNDDKRKDINFLDNLRENNKMNCLRCMIYDHYHYERCQEQKALDDTIIKNIERDIKRKKSSHGRVKVHAV